ncbi:MAG TPA: metallophosphoesterase family protein [Solirubrobacteraceae bacterium]|nr:metallophosphoesterase family protein [Solirubrobacteraceae bacterium]
MLLAIISDTHLPRGPRRLPQACVDRLETADLILHAGDFSSATFLHALESIGSVAGVHGNVDDREVRRRMPERRVVEAGGARIAMVHDAGPALGRVERMRRRFPGVDAVVFGHSHIPLLERASGGRRGRFQIFNPGSPTERRRSPHHTMGMARVEDGRVDFELIDLD